MNTKKAVGTPKWNEARQCWEIQVRRNYERKWFRSSNPSPRKGPEECLRNAKEWFNAFEEAKSIKFGAAWQLFMDYYEQKFKPTSAMAISSRGKAHLLPRFKRVKLGDISKRDWQQVINDAYHNGAKSQKTLKGISTTIKTFCIWAASNGYIADANVPQYFDFPTKVKVNEKKILQPDDLALLFSEEENNASWYIPMWRFIVLTGLRRGEICALQLQRDFDPKEHTITIRESISHEGYVTAGKTSNAQRKIYLAPLALAQLTSHREQVEKLGLSRSSTTYLFTDERGERISPRALRNHWQRWREAHDISLTIHELRHTYISYSRLKTEISLDDLKELYGHSKSMDTERTYVHAIELSPEELKAQNQKKLEAALAIDATFSAIIKPSLAEDETAAEGAKTSGQGTADES